ECYRDGRSAREAVMRRQNLSCAQNQQRGCKVSDAVRKNSGEEMPIRFWKLREAGGKAWRAVAFIRNSSWREKRECQPGGEAGQQSPAQNSARAKRSNQCRRAQRAEHCANRVHRAFKSERAALLFQRNTVGQQRVARWAAAPAPYPSKRAHHQNRRPSLREGVCESGKP